MASDRQYREGIVRFGRMLHERGFVPATDGNLSVRLDSPPHPGYTHFYE